MNLQPWQIIAGVFTSSGFGGVVSSAFTWLSNRKKNDVQAHAYAQGAVDHAVQTAFGGMETVVNGLKGEVERLSALVERGQKQHDECERKLGEVRHDLDASKRNAAQERADLLSQIDNLMRGRVANYDDEAPK